MKEPPIKDIYGLRTWVRVENSEYKCCWPDINPSRKSCTRPVGYVELKRRYRRFSRETVFEPTYFGLCDQHWSKRDAKRPKG